MKKLIALAFSLCISFASSAQFIATMEVKEPIEGLCDQKTVYVMLPGIKGHQEAKCAVSEEEIQQRLDSLVTFVKSNPKYKGEGMLSIIVNCEGEVVQCEMDNKTKKPELDEQIVAVFKSLTEWESAKLNGKDVDSLQLYSFTIKKGKITLE
jgi:hypothetical protein